MLKIKNPIEKHFEKITCYHIYFFVFIFLSKIPVYWHIMNMIFLSPPMNYTCLVPFKGKPCPCDDPDWDKSVFTQTMQTKYGIVCDQAWLVSFSQSMLYVGTLIGALLFGFLSDLFGRLSMFTLSCFWLGITGCLVIVMPTVTTYTVMRCLEGVGVGGAIVIGFVLLIEFCGTKHREMVTALYHIPINIGHISLAGMSYLMRDCDVLQLGLSLPVFLCVVIWFLVYESPKWLMDRGNIPKAAKVMQKISKFNKNNSCDTIEEEMNEFCTARDATAQTKVHFFQIFRHRKLSRNLLCMSFIYFVTGMGYYGVAQYIGTMSGDIHLNVAISGTLLIPGTLSTAFLLRLMSRRRFLMLTNFFSGVFMLAVIFIPADYPIVRMVMASIGCCFFFMSFVIVFLYSVELFPTSVRNSVLGFLSVLSRLGQIIAPPINSLNPTVAGAIFGVAAIIGAALCYPLPETKHIDLPSTLEDSKALPRTRQQMNEDIQLR
ncbi:solute carrier family 22 member 3-like [Anticarsia gemmatalis]|uniref:solute carrier family 22 member 3-like n=1 Tax=Anticarsia gemmatalis TaxID=129554 RepID=UPI003F76548D